MKTSLLHSNAFSASEFVRWESNGNGVRLSPELHSFRGSSARCYASKSVVHSVDLRMKKYLGLDYVYEMNRKESSRSGLIPPAVELLDRIDDEYGGVVVDPNGLPSEATDFASRLRFSLSQWKMKGKKGVWLKLPLERADLVPVAAKEGFQYHHAEPGYVMMTLWLPGGPNKLPGNASHQVGIGGFVVNDNNEILVVQENFCDSSFCGLWKIPTGFILEAEEIYAGAVREVKEETGVDTEFQEVVAFRHAQNLAFDKSDLFFVCMLRPLSSEIIVDDHEINAARWMPLDDFVEQPMIQEDSMFKKIVEICVARHGKRYCGLTTEKLHSMFDGRISSLYYNVLDTAEETCSGFEDDSGAC